MQSTDHPQNVIEQLQHRIAELERENAVLRWGDDYIHSPGAEKQQSWSDLQRDNNQLRSDIAQLQKRLAEREQQQVEDALWKNQKLLQLVIDSLPLAIFWKDRNSVYLGCNNYFARVAGVGLPENIVGKTDYDLAWKPAEADWFRLCDRRVMESGDPEYSIVEPQLQADGKQAWLETNKIPLRNPNGEIIGILGAFQDITERQQVDQLIREREHKFRAIFNSTFECILLLSPEGNVLDANRTALKFGGLQLSQVRGQRVWETPWFSPLPASQKILRKGIECALKSEYCQLEMEVWGVAGICAHVEFTLKPILDEQKQVTALLYEGRDVTAYRKVEQNLRESEARLRGMFEGAAIGIAVDDLQGRLITSNPALQKILGYSQEELNQVSFMDLTHPDDQAMEWELFQELISGNRNSYQIEKRDLRKDGQVVWVRLTNSLIRDEAGNPKFTIAMAEDITDRKRAEAALKQSQQDLQQLNWELERRVTDRTAELSWINQQLQEEIRQRKQAEKLLQETAVLEERNRIACEIHDTLAQGFTGISIQASVAKRIANTHPEDLLTILDRIIQLAQAGLAEARRSVWMLHLEDSYSDMATTLQQAIQQQLTGTSLELQFSVQGTPRSLPGIVGSNLLRITQEAVTNTLRHAQAQTILAELTFSPTKVSLRIQDDGQGFDPLSSLENRGFGLFGMQQRCDRLGGQLHIRSQPGCGTEISVQIALEILET